MDNIQEMAAMTALNDMFKKGYFNICTIDNIAKMANVNPKGRSYNILHTLHCVDFDKMPKELREEVPNMIRECLSLSPIYEFEHLRKQKVIVGQSPMGRLIDYIKR